MELFEAIEARRSIRRFKPDGLPREIVEKILRAGTLAPSAKNGQQWRFVVVTEQGKADMLDAYNRGLQATRDGGGLWKAPPAYLRDAEFTRDIMASAPVNVFIFNAEAQPLDEGNTPAEKLSDSTALQSVSAAIQNMCLAATALGVGSLWICNTFFAYRELFELFGEQGRMVAALTLGYPGHAPPPRPRKSIEEVTRWL